MPEGATVVVALGGNALLRRGEPLSSAAQRRNVRSAAGALAALADRWRLVVTHGNGPQVGLLAAQEVRAQEDAERAEGEAAGGFPLDVLGAETEGMIGYVVAQELRNALGDREVASLLTQVLVDAEDPAFEEPTKPIGPPFDERVARRMEERHGWCMVREEEGDARSWRRVVPSPRPRAVLEIAPLRTLVEHDVVVVCGGGGGIPVVRDADGRLSGVEAVVDKDRTTALIARQLDARALLLLTDVDGVYLGWGTDEERRLEEVTVERAAELDLPPGSMGPKVEACAGFVRDTGGFAAIGRLEDAAAVLAGRAGTRFVP